MKKIIIKSVDFPPSSRNPDAVISWFCEALGLSNQNDPESIESEILKRFLLAASKNAGISSSGIKLGKGIPRSTIIYHLNRLVESGLVVKRGRKYYMRSQALATSIEEIEYDIDREFQRMIDVAREFDRLFLQRAGNHAGNFNKGKVIKIE